MAATLTFGRRTSSHSCVIVLQLQLLMHLHTIRDAAFELSADNTALLFGLEDVLLMVSQNGFPHISSDHRTVSHSVSGEDDYSSGSSSHFFVL